MTKEQTPQDANEGTKGPSRSTVGLGAWLPIETVPINGNAVLVFLEADLHHSRIHAATFHPNITVIGNLSHF